MHRLWLGLAILLVTAPLLHAQEQSEVETPPDTALVGLYVTALYDLDMAHKGFNIDFWLWFNFRKDSLKPMETVEIANAKEFSFSLPDTEKEGELNWACHKCKALIKKDWNLRHFPFDKQSLEVRVEDAILDRTQLVYLPDVAHTNYDRTIVLDEWIIRDFYIKPDDHVYATNFGNPTLDSSSTYPAVTAVFEIHRDGMGLFFKLFVGVFVAYLISLLVFFMGPENPERFGLIVGALFAGVANKYIVDSLMPSTAMLTLPDKIHNVTFAYIILHLALTVVAHRLAVNRRMKHGWWVDRIAFLTSLASYIAINWSLVRSAVAYL